MDTKNMEIKEVIEKLCSFGERQLKQNVLAKEFIISLFDCSISS